METYRGGSTNQGLRRLLRKYAEGGPFPEPALRDEDTYGPDTGQYRTDRAQATSDVVKAALAKSNAAMAARPMEPDLMGYQTRQAPEGYWYDDAGFMRNPQGQEVTPERRPSVIPFDKYGDFTNSKLLELAGNLSGGILAPVRGAQGAFLLGSGPVRKAVEVAAQQVPRELSPLGFYSHGAETAANLAQAKGAPDQMTAMLRKYGVKPDELYNAGIADETATNVMRSKIEREYAPKLAAAKLEMDALGLNENTINKKSPDYNKALEIRQSPETKAKYQYDSTLNAMRSDMDSAMVLHPEWSARPSVTREELAKHFKERRPQVEETVLGAKANKYPYRDADEWQTAINQAERRRDFDEAERLTLAWEESEGIGAQGAPKFQKYTLPGGENYREVLLKTPDESGALRKETAEAASLRTQAVADYANAAPGSPEAVEAQDRIKKYVKLHNELIDKKFSMPPTEYRSQHWDDPNVLAHLRMADRTGPNGEKILHVEEIQSDWGQKGKKEGFDKPKVDLKPFEADRELARMASVRLAQNMIERESGGRFNSLSEVLDSGDVDLINRMRAAKKTDPELIAANETFQAADRALQEARAGNRSNIPSAPYVTNTAAWTDLALKRALKEAAEGGYDKLVWTPGAEQAKRYDLSKQISRLVLENDPAGGHKLRAYSPSGDQVINKRIVDADRELPDLIGKEVAKKLLDQDLVNPKVFNEKLTSNDIIVVPKENRYQISAPWGWSTHVGMGVVDSPEAAAEYGARHFSNLAKEANSNMGTSHATEYKNATRSLIGLDLEVGGKGMKAYYDKIIPNQLSKLVKKLDPEARIGTHEIRTGDDTLTSRGISHAQFYTMTPEQRRAAIEASASPSMSVPSLTITPKMREAIMKGQTDFARGGPVQGYATGGPTDNSLEALYNKYHAKPTMRQRTRKTVAGIDPERDRDQPVIDPATMGEEWNRARRNYQNFPRQEGEAVARPLELGARDRLAGYIAGGAREPGAQSRRSLADLLLGSTGLPDSGTLGVGVADLPMVTGIPLALADIVHDIGQGDYASTAMGAALPAAFYARGPLGAAGKRAVKIANDYAKPIAGVAGVAATMTPEDAEAAKLRVPAGVRQILSGTPENADHIAFLLRNGRGTEVTNALANTADPITLLRHYLSGGTGAEMPMGRAARMGRAKEGGYHTEKPYYHAGDPKTAFDNSRGELYATTDKSFAKAYRADKNYGDVRSLLSRHQNTIEGDDVIDFFHNKVSSRNPSGVNIKYGWQAFDPDHLAGVGGDPRDASKLLPALKKAGFDSAFFPEDFPPTSSYTDPSSSRAFFYPETLRDISARFDPRLSHVSNLDYAQGGEVKNYARGGSVKGYAEGGPVSSAAIYDPAEIDALAASIIEGNYA